MSKHPFGALKTIEEIILLVDEAKKKDIEIPLFSFYAGHIEKCSITPKSRLQNSKGGDEHSRYLFLRRSQYDKTGNTSNYNSNICLNWRNIPENKNYSDFLFYNYWHAYAHMVRTQAKETK